MPPTTPDPSFIGTVQDVNGASVRIELLPGTVTGLSFVNGQPYRVGQIGSFVRIPLGFVNLYGIVSQVGAGAAPAPATGDAENPYGNRWLLIQLVGEGRYGGRFERGLSQHPTIDDPVHIVTEADLRTIYGPGEPDDHVSVGRLASAESIPALVDINKLLTRHSAVVGTTGAGKSTTVAGLLTSLSNPHCYPSSRIVVFDVHGEYAKALQDRCTVYRVGSTLSPKSNERPLRVPYWALTSNELITLAFGGMDQQKAPVISDYIVDLKREALARWPRVGVTPETVTADTPVPFSIHKLWFELHRKEYLTVIPQPGGTTDERVPAYVLDATGQALELGDAMKVKPPLYRTVKTTGPAAERVQHANEGIGIRQQVNILASKLRDPRFSFLFNPGDWLPNIEGKTAKDIDALLEDWIGAQAPITILDLSGIPSTILTDLIGALTRILYDAVFWARNLPEGGRERPLLLVLEEAHAYLNASHANFASDVVKRIAKEGRKYGVGLMVVSQRPSEIDTTILSQCGTLFAMRLANDTDRSHVTGSASDNLKGLFDMLPILRTGEAVIVGEAVSLPIRTLIEAPPKNRRPDSTDPRVVVRGSLAADADGYDGPGGWNQRRDYPQNYPAVARQWRQQTPLYEHAPASASQEAPTTT
jgi:hypothetical protein